MDKILAVVLRCETEYIFSISFKNYFTARVSSDSSVLGGRLDVFIKQAG